MGTAALIAMMGVVLISFSLIIAVASASIVIRESVRLPTRSEFSLSFMWLLEALAEVTLLYLCCYHWCRCRIIIVVVVALLLLLCLCVEPAVKFPCHWERVSL